MARIDLKNASTLNKEKQEVLKIANQLRYSKEIIEKIQNAKSVLELDRIMKSARGSK
jgi:hypothetical protein